MTNQRNGLSKTIRRFYGIGDFAFALMMNIPMYYSMYFFTDVTKIGLAAATFINGVSGIVDTAISWIYGAVMNSIKPLKWGRYRSWLIIMAPIMIPLFFFQYMVVGGSVIFMTAYYFIVQLVARVAMNFSYVANITMINIVAKTPDEKVLMASNRATYNNASKFAWSYLGVPFVALLTATFGTKYAFAVFSCLLCCLTVVTYYAHFRMFEGYEDTGAEEMASVVKAKRARTGGMDLVRGLFANPPLLFLMLTDFAKWLFNFSLAGTIVYYFKYVANDMPSMVWYTLIVAAMSVLGAYFSRQVGKALGAKMTLVVGFVVMAICLFIGRLVYTQMWTLIVLLAAAQLFYGVTYSVASAMYADTAVYNEWKTGKNASGWIMGLINIPLKAAGTVCPFILGALFASGGVNPNILPGKASMQVKDAVANTLLVVPGAVLLLGALVLFFGYQLTKPKLQQMQKEIDEKRAAEEAANEAK